MIDTHCHIHSKFYELDEEAEYKTALDSGVEHMVCVGVDEDDSQKALNFAASHEHVSASVGLHPHDAKHGAKAIEKIATLSQKSHVVAIGECGLDYFYEHTPRDIQKEMLKQQLVIGHEQDLPFIFHVRGSKVDFDDAFRDLWELLADYPDARGVVHSFTAHKPQLEQIQKRGLAVGLNGIMTFTKDVDQLDTLQTISLNEMLLETDAPFLTPTPYRGKVNAPQYLRYVAEFIADFRGEELEKLVKATSSNAKQLFGI